MLKLPLLVVGRGATGELRQGAASNIRFIDAVSDQDLAQHLSRCKALIFPGVEDFGIVPVEAMASGRPVIAYARGGALETVIHGKTGILFYEQSARALAEAVIQLESGKFSFEPYALREFAAKFDRSRFSQRISDFIFERIAESKGEKKRMNDALPHP